MEIKMRNFFHFAHNWSLQSNCPDEKCRTRVYCAGMNGIGEIIVCFSFKLSSPLKLAPFPIFPQKDKLE